MARPRPRPQLRSRSQRRVNTGALPLFDIDERPLIRLQTLGAAVVLVGDSRLSAAAGTSFSLLLRLTGAPGMMLDRHVLRCSLWPDQEEVRQRANLRQALYKLRGYGVRVSMHGDTVILDESQVVRSFSLERTADTFERDVTLGHEPFGPYLPGFTVPWPDFREWLDVQREIVHSDVRRVLIEQMRRRRDRADWGGADALARWLLQFDPLNEEATLTVAECTALSGSKREALEILDRYLAELGPSAGDIRLPASMLRKRIAEPSSRGRRSFAPTERHFVGREEELAELTLAMRRARWHDGGAVLLHGPPGMGKSRLVHELEKVAVIEGVRVTQTSCRESDGLRPMSVFLDILPELMSCAGALGSAPESLAALRRLVPTVRRASVTTESSSDGDAGSHTTQQGAVDAEREPLPMASSLRRAIIDLLSAVSDEKPLLLIIEDVHWIDEHSWDVLSDLIDRTSALRVFLVLTSRESHARPQRPQRVPLSLRVHALPPLSPDRCLMLSRAIGEDLSALVSDELGEWFVRASEGVPLFLRALVNHWIETGDAGGVPPTLQAVIEQRLSQLSGDALRVLQTGALLGKWATCDRVQRVLQLRSKELLRSLEQLEVLGMISPTMEDCSLRTNDLVLETALARMMLLTKRTLHANVADVLRTDALGAGNTELLLAALEHLQQGGDARRLHAITLCHLDLIVACGVPALGLRAVDRIQAEDAGPEDRRRFIGARARLLHDAGQYSRAVSDPLKGLKLPDLALHHSENVLDTALTFVDSAYRADPFVDRDELSRFTVALAELSYLGDAIRIRAADIGLVIASNACDAATARRLFAAVEVAERGAGRSDAGRRAAILFHTQFGNAETARQLADDLYESAACTDPSTTAFQAALRAGFAHRIVSDGNSHLASLQLAFEIAEKIALPAHSLNAGWLLAQSYLELGDLSNFEYWHGQVHRLFVLLGDPVVGNFAVGLFCRTAIERSDRAGARRCLETFLKHLPKLPTVKLAAYALSLNVAVDLLNDRWIPSHEMLSALLARHAKVAHYGTSDFITSVSVEGLLRCGDRHNARLLLAEYVGVQRREVGPLGARLARTQQLVGAAD